MLTMCVTRHQDENQKLLGTVPRITSYGLVRLAYCQVGSLVGFGLVPSALLARQTPSPPKSMFPKAVWPVLFLLELLGDL